MIGLKNRFFTIKYNIKGGVNKWQTKRIRKSKQRKLNNEYYLIRKVVLNISLSNIVIKLIGLVGVLFLGAGIYIVRGGNITL